jgi:hypothetical protein
MPTHLRVSTPQFRTALIRKLKNLHPGFQVEFVEVNRGVAFLLRDKRGRARSTVINIYRNSGDALERAKLEALLEAAGFRSPKQ